LAAGLGFLGVGSDIGGSIRAPAHCCGIFGHKPTLDIVSLSGHAPGGQAEVPGFSTLLAVAGPLARTAEELEAALRVIAGPEKPDSIAYSWKLPAPRHERLRDFRIGYVLEDPMFSVSSEVKPELESAVRACEKAGAKMQPGVAARVFLRRILFHLPVHAGGLHDEHLAARGAGQSAQGVRRKQRRSHGGRIARGLRSVATAQLPTAGVSRRVAALFPGRRRLPAAPRR
jgi:Asp-tRNA(Asn)/Glu-tRNA(Gln) amidotransferase A subunit family amidase